MKTLYKPLYTTHDAFEAHLIAQTLQDYGIRAAVFDENVAAVGMHLSQVIGGIRVMVNEADWFEAVDILATDFDIVVQQKPPVAPKFQYESGLLFASKMAVGFAILAILILIFALLRLKNVQ